MKCYRFIKTITTEIYADIWADSYREAYNAVLRKYNEDPEDTDFDCTRTFESSFLLEDIEED